jgi:hypothetical protein
MTRGREEREREETGRRGEAGKNLDAVKGRGEEAETHKIFSPYIRGPASTRHHKNPR